MSKKKGTVKVRSQVPPCDDFFIVAIGASPGGFEACKLLLKNLATDTGMAFVIIFHLLPTRESLAAQIFRKSTRMSVAEAMSGMEVEPKHIYVIPPNTQMSVRNRSATRFALRTLYCRRLDVRKNI